MGEKLPKITGVIRCKSLWNRCKVVYRKEHNPWAPELTFVASLTALDTADKQKSRNFGCFGPCRVHSKKFCRANPRLHERARALSSSVL